MSFLKHDLKRNTFMLTGKFARLGYDWWWHSFTGRNVKTGKEKSFFIEFFLCNPAIAEDKPMLGQLSENKKNGKKPSYLMVKAGSWGKDAAQLHSFFAWKDVVLHRGVPYSVKAGDCSASDTCLCGHISVSGAEASRAELMSDAGEMSWNLKINKIIPFNVGYGAGALFRALKAFQMYWHVERMKSEYSGEVIWNGVKYTVTPEDSYGYADKNWGSDFTTPWVWLSSCDLTSRKTGEKLHSSAFDIGGGAPKVFGNLLERKLLSAFSYEGKPYEFNFSKFLTFTKTEFDCKETDTEIIWRVVQENLFAKMETDIRCEKSDMLLINYEAPGGEKLHNRLWNGGNGYGTVTLYKKRFGTEILVDTVDARHVGCEYGEMDKNKEKS